MNANELDCFATTDPFFSALTADDGKKLDLVSLRKKY